MKTRRSIRLRLLTLALVLLTLAAAPSLHAQMLLNGSFENPTLAAGGDAAGSGANWTTTGADYVITNGFGDGTTTYGNQWEYLTQTGTDAQTLTGTVTLGNAYTLSLVAADVFGSTGDQLTLRVSGAATASQTFAVPQNPNPLAALPLVTYSLAFTPTAAGSVTVTLANASTGGGYLALDNVAVAPEPSTWALLGVGAAGLGLTLRRQRRRARRA